MNGVFHCERCDVHLPNGQSNSMSKYSDVYVLSELNFRVRIL